MSGEDVLKARDTLRAITALGHNLAWKEVVLPALELAFRQAAEGLTSPQLSAEERGEFLQGYHTLLGIVGDAALRRPSLLERTAESLEARVRTAAHSGIAEDE